LAAFLIVVLTQPPSAVAGFLAQNYPNAGFVSGGGNAVIGKHHSGDQFGDGTTTRQYADYLQPFNPLEQSVNGGLPAMLTNIFNNKDSLGHTFGNTYSLVAVPFSAPNNELTIKSYSTFAVTGGGVGADMYVSYTQVGGNDPAAASVQWLQVVADNWSITQAPQGPGNPEALVDVTAASNVPFYDQSYDANIGSTYLFDRPTRDTTQLANYNGAFPLTWTADTFAVVDTHTNDANGKDIIDVYGGFQWGWQVTVAPEPASVILLSCGCVCLCGIACVRDSRHLRRCC
jgi:hypothetical protein